MSRRECSTQDEADAAAAAGDVIVWREGELYAHGSARVFASDSERVFAYGSARVYASDSASVYASDSATVYASGSAIVFAYGSASVFDKTTGAPLYRARPRIILGPLGSRGDTLGVSLPSDGTEPVVYAGCWSGRLSEFAARVDKIYPAGRYGNEYRAAIAMLRAVAAIPQEDV